MLSKIKPYKSLSYSQRVLFIVLTSILVSSLTNPIFGSFQLFLVLIIFISPIIPSQFATFRISIVAILLIGLSPLYLVARGFFTRSQITNWDLQIYFFTFAAFALLFGSVLSRTKDSELFESRFVELKKTIPSFFGLFFSVIVTLFLQSKSIGHAVAWISSGDSKNHLVNSGSITNYGFLDPGTFLTQPVSSPTFLSLILSQSGENLTVDPSTLSYQILTYAYVWVLLIGVLGLTFSATLEVIWKKFYSEGNTPSVLLILLSIIPLFSFILGPALFDGFFTAIFGISALVAMTLWYIESFQNQQKIFSFGILGSLVFFSTLMSWMFVATLTSLLLTFGLRNLIKNLKVQYYFVDLLIFTAFLFGALLIHFSELGQSFIYQAKVALSVTGAVNSSNPNFYVVAMIGLLLIGVSDRHVKKQNSQIFISLGILNLVALIFLKNFSNLGINSWNYYLIKYQWIMLSSLLAVLVSYVFVKVYLLNLNKPFRRNTSLLLLLLSIFLTSESIVPANNVWQKIVRGWENPRSEIMNIVLSQKLDFKNPTMFFHYGYAGDAMLGNFWMNAYSDPMDPIRGWNYTIDTAGDPKQLCEVNAYYPQVTVLTQDLELQEQLKSLCENEVFIVKVIPAYF